MTTVLTELEQLELHVYLETKIMYPEFHFVHDIPGLDTTSVAFGTDAPRSMGDHKKHSYGPGSIRVAHGPDEYIGVTELVESIDLLEASTC